MCCIVIGRCKGGGAMMPCMEGFVVVMLCFFGLVDYWLKVFLVHKPTCFT